MPFHILGMAIADHASDVRTGTGNALPGLILCVAVACAAAMLSAIETAILGRAWLDALPVAIILGVVIRSSIRLGRRFDRGICISSKTVLEIAVVLLGASIDPAAALAAGPMLLLGIVLVVGLSIPLSYGVGRLLGLKSTLAMLIACGNSICGNSAIAATAPVIHAEGRDVACSIAFTAILGVAGVLLLPLLVPALGWSANQYGVFAGLTVYAVPQVLAATAPVSAASLQIGTLVKLVRVLMLGPVIATLGLLYREKEQRRPDLAHLLPWFIAGFLVMLAARSFGFIPEGALPVLSGISSALAVISMAGLGLSADIRSLTRVGGRVLAAAILSLGIIGVLSYGLIVLLGID